MKKLFLFLFILINIFFMSGISFAGPTVIRGGLNLFGGLDADTIKVDILQGLSISNVTVTDASITLTSAHFGKSVRMSSASDYTASLPSVGADDDGARIRICKTGAGKVTVVAADSDLINDSGAGDTIYNSTAETYAFIDLEYAHAITTWIATGTGTWTTTN